MANTNFAKGNPASKRMSNVNRKARRQKSWSQGRQRKAANVAAQNQREQQNAHRGYTDRELRRALAWRASRPALGDGDARHVEVLSLAGVV